MPEKILQDVECSVLNRHYQEDASQESANMRGIRNRTSSYQIVNPRLKAQIEYDSEGNITEVYCKDRERCKGPHGDNRCIFFR